MTVPITIHELLWRMHIRLNPMFLRAPDVVNEIIGVAIDFVDTDPIGCATLFHAQARKQWAVAVGLRHFCKSERNRQLRDRAIETAKHIERVALVYEYCALSLGLAQYGVKP